VSSNVRDPGAPTPSATRPIGVVGLLEGEERAALALRPARVPIREALLAEGDGAVE
jgi:hypothetical protein